MKSLCRLLVWGCVGLLICVHPARADDGNEATSNDAAAASVIQAFKRVTGAVEATRNHFKNVKVSGEYVLRTPMVSDTAEGKSQGESSNSVVRYRIEFLYRDFGLHRRIVQLPDAAAPAQFAPMRMVVTPDRVLDGDDLSQGYVRPVDDEWSRSSDFLAAFWLPHHTDQAPSRMVPGNHAVASLWTVTDLPAGRTRLASQLVDARHRFVLEFASASSLPELYEAWEDGELVEKCEWEWGQVSGFDYPRHVRGGNRHIDTSGAVKWKTSDLVFNSVELAPNVSDKEFGFAALGLKPGTPVFDMRDPDERRVAPDRIPGLEFVLPAMAVAIPALCLWLGVRIFNRRERWAKRTAVGLAGLVVYLAGFGPAFWLVDRGYLAARPAALAYLPLLEFLFHTEGSRAASDVQRYAALGTANDPSWTLTRLFHAAGLVGWSAGVWPHDMRANVPHPSNDGLP